MSRRPLCMIGCLVVLILWILNLMGVSTFGGTPLDLTDSESSVIIQGILYKQESNSFYTSLYLKKTNLIQNSKKQSIENVKATIKTEYLKQLPLNGDRLLMQGKLKQIPEPGNPGQFHEQSYYYARKIKWYLEAEQVTVQKAEADKGVTLRSRLKELLKTKLKQITTKKTSGLLMAILLGEKSEVERETLLRMQLSAMSHCIVVSGTHLSILGWGLFRLLRKARIPLWMSGIVSIFLMIQYGIFTGNGASAVRAVIMFSMAVGAVIVGRTYDMLSALALAVLLLLLDNPKWLTDSGFLLSFGAVIGLSIFYPQLKSKKENKLGNTVLGSIAVLLVTLPIQMYAFYEIPLFGILVNLFVLPTIGIVLISGMTGCVSAFLSPFVGKILAFPAVLILNFYLKIGEVIQSVPQATYITGSISLKRAVIYYGLLALWCFLKKKSEKIPRAGLILAVLILLFPMPKTQTKITFLDVGQGDCAVIQQKEEVYVIDGGSSDVSKVGTYRILPFLKYHGIRSVDGIFLSHPDDDHINGIEELLEAVAKKETSLKIKNVYLSKNKEKEEKINEIAQLAKRAGCRVRYIKTGAQLKQKAFQIECLSPENETGDSNENSQVLLFKTEHLSVLFTGDMEEKGEDAVTEQLKERQEHIDILKVPHHGSKNSTKEAFLEAVNAQIGIISCGKDNSYGHPHKELLERLKKNQVSWYITSERGAITVTAGKRNKLSFHWLKSMIK